MVVNGLKAQQIISDREPNIMPMGNAPSQQPLAKQSCSLPFQVEDRTSQE